MSSQSGGFPPDEQAATTTARTERDTVTKTFMRSILASWILVRLDCSASPGCPQSVRSGVIGKRRRLGATSQQQKGSSTIRRPASGPRGRSGARQSQMTRPAGRNAPAVRGASTRRLAGAAPLLRLGRVELRSVSGCAIGEETASASEVARELVVDLAVDRARSSADEPARPDAEPRRPRASSSSMSGSIEPCARSRFRHGASARAPAERERTLPRGLRPPSSGEPSQAPAHRWRAARARQRLCQWHGAAWLDLAGSEHQSSTVRAVGLERRRPTAARPPRSRWSR